MTPAFRQDIESMYVIAAHCDSLSILMAALYDVLRRNEESLVDVTYAYRLDATDTGYTSAFMLDHGRFAMLAESDWADVTVIGPENNLLAIFQRKLNPAAALLFGKIKINGSKSALMKLTSFL